MKRKAALLLAVVMVMSLLPMNVFGIHPAQFSQVVRPNDDALNYTLQIDARALSGAIIPEGGNLFLEFEISGENAGFRFFRNNEPRRELVNGVYRELSERLWPEVIMPSWADRYTGVGGQLAFRVQGGAQFSGGAGSVAWINQLQQMSGGTTPPALVDGTRVNGAETTLRQALDSASGASTWSGEFTNGLRRRMYQDRGFRMSDATAANGGVDTAAMEHWRRIEMPLVELPGGYDWGNAAWMSNFQTTVGGIQRFALPEMEGWITIQLPAVAPNPGSQVTARLRSISAHGAITTVRNLGTFDMIAGEHANGVTIESRGVAPMTNISRLNPIRITEDIPGMLAPHVEGLVEGTGHHIVRIVAPRNFRWDDYLMRGYLHQQEVDDAVTISGNPVTWPGNRNEGIRDAGGHARVLDMWLNPVTDRHEIYIHLLVPARDSSTIGGRVSRAWVDLEGLVMFPIAGAPTTGDVAVDVWIGTTNGAVADQWAIGNANPSGAAGNVAWDTHRGNQVFEVGRTLTDGTVRQTRFGWFGENDAPGSRAPAGVPGWRQDSWSRMNIVVANLDHEGGITVTGPAAPANLVSGRTNAALNVTGNDRFLHGGNHTIRLRENAVRSMFSTFDRYEVRVTTEGVHIVDAEIRVGNPDAIDYEFGWTALTDIHRRREAVGNRVVTAYTDFDGGSVFFAPRTKFQDEEGRLRQMDIRLMLSVEAGFEANFGGQVGVDVFRNNQLLGSTVIANVTDPIRVERAEQPTHIYRHQFDVIPLTPVGGFTITENQVMALANNDEVWIHVQATQGGNPVYIPQGMLTMFLGNITVNEAQSSMVIEPLRGAAGNVPRSFPGDRIMSPTGLRIVRPSSGNPGVITVESMYVAGPTVPWIDWHVVVTGAARTYDQLIGTGYELVRNYTYSGISPNSHRFFPARIDYSTSHPVGSGENLGTYQERARMFGMGYNTTFLRVIGDPHIDEHGPADGPGPNQGTGNQQLPPIARRSFTTALVNVDGYYIQAAAFPRISENSVSSMMNPRVFADFVGAQIDWNPATRQATFTGICRGGNTQTVVLTLDSPVAMVNGESRDIAQGAMQPAYAGRIHPVVINDRVFVPARFLANIFGVPIDFAQGTVILG